MYSHWTQALDAALVATYIWSQTMNVTMEEAREQVAHEADIHHKGDVEECCWFITFGYAGHIPYKKTIEEVLTPILAEHGITWEQYINDQKRNKLA